TVRGIQGHVAYPHLADNPIHRLGSSIACACRAVAAGAGIVRVHDVRETAQALRTWEAINGA
ncbi:MAG: hypothetical protein P8J63_02505, partial [Verrucomicrobiota bacterium]|nr:hypothetical protein [Verrucomicrobiota bacterium]